VNATNKLDKINNAAPEICYNLYVSGAYQNDQWKRILYETILENVQNPFSNIDNVTQSGLEGIVQLNDKGFVNFLVACGSALTSIHQNLTETLQLSHNGTFSNSLTFNWVICTPSGRGLGNRATNWSNNTERRPQAQKDYFISVWEADQQELYQSYFNATYDGSNLEHAKLFAYNQSIQSASGESRCSYNIAGTAWFWFTILSTMGYGNQAPVTKTGRALVYTAGFVSILLFAAVLALAGHVVTAIVDDILARLKLAFLNKPWIACIMWGALYYLWMMVIAAKTINWKRRRLGDDFSSNDAFWFAYISTTTVGLGDYYLEPEVFTGGDLITWPFTMLIGFVFLASFLGKFAALLSDISGRGEKNESIIDQILSHLKSRDMVGDVSRMSDIRVVGNNTTTTETTNVNN
jgi:Ion channel